MFVIFTFGVFCWLIYGILNNDHPSNLVTLPSSTVYFNSKDNQ